MRRPALLEQEEADWTGSLVNVPCFRPSSLVFNGVLRFIGPTRIESRSRRSAIPAGMSFARAPLDLSRPRRQDRRNPSGTLRRFLRRDGWIFGAPRESQLGRKIVSGSIMNRDPVCNCHVLPAPGPRTAPRPSHLRDVSGPPREAQA